jgi:hypothetical protein
MDAHLGPRADGAAGEQRGPGGQEAPVAHPGPVQVRVRSDQHVVADHRRMPGPPADQGVLHHHRAVTDRDLAVFGGEHGPEQDACTRPDAHRPAQDRRRRDISAGIDLRNTAAMLD